MTLGLHFSAAYPENVNLNSRQLCQIIPKSVPTAGHALTPGEQSCIRWTFCGGLRPEITACGKLAATRQLKLRLIVAFRLTV